MGCAGSSLQSSTLKASTEAVTARDKVTAWLNSLDTSESDSDSDTLHDIFKTTSKPSSLDDKSPLTPPTSKRGAAPPGLHSEEVYPSAAARTMAPPHVYKSGRHRFQLVVGLAGEPPHPGGPIRHAYTPPSPSGRRKTPTSGRSRHKWARRSRGPAKCTTRDLLPSSSQMLPASPGVHQLKSISDAVLVSTTSPHPDGPLRHEWYPRDDSAPPRGQSRHFWEAPRPMYPGAEHWPTSWRQPHEVPGALQPVAR